MEVFDVQVNTISGASSDITGKVTGSGTVFQLFGHNFRVMIFCLMFAFVYGFGSIFLLTWNASVVGVAIGEATRSAVGGSFVTAITAGLARYLIHGIPEIIAYFTAGLAGGIISIAVINHDFKSKKFKNVVTDSFDLVLLSVGLLVVAAVLEAYVSPTI